MLSRDRIATLSLLLFAASFLTAQQSLTNANAIAENCAVAGKVLSADGHPASGIHVELDEVSTALPVTSTYTEKDGSFEIYNIPRGNYEVVAESESAEVSDQVSLENSRPSLELHLPRNANPPSLSPSTVSVIQMLVPEKAQKLYTKAQQEFAKRRYSQAKAIVEQALIIEPEFPSALTLLGLIDLGSPDLSAAQRSLEHATKLDVGNAAAFIGLAAVYNHQGRFDDALNASSRGLSLAPNAWQAYMEMAKASVAKQMYQNALHLLRRAETLGGTGFAEVHLVKAYALVALKLYKPAHDELQASVARDPKGPAAVEAQAMLARLGALETIGVHPTK